MLRYGRDVLVVAPSLIVLGLAACERSRGLTEPEPTPVLSVPSTPSATVMTLLGEQFYGDDASGDLVPTSFAQQARIEGERSDATLECPGGHCYAAFKSYHRGMWHWTAQTINWRLLNDETNAEIIPGSSIPKGGGEGCDTWAGIFCTNKKQQNEHSVTANAPFCKVRASVTTDHMAGYGRIGNLSAGGWSIEVYTWGDNSKSSSNSVLYTDSGCNQCDDPYTDEIETECDPTNDGDFSHEAGDTWTRDSGPASQGGDSNWYCMMTDWYDVWMDGSRHYTHTTVDGCWVKGG